MMKHRFLIMERRIYYFNEKLILNLFQHVLCDKWISWYSWCISLSCFRSVENNSESKESPIEIQIKISVINIRSVKEPDLVIIKWGILNGTIYRLLPQTLIMDVFLHQFWIDKRINVPSNLGKDKIVLDNSFRTKLWMPQTYFKNSIGGSLLGTIFPSIYFTIDGEKNVFMAIR